jgi:hypothetical protein
MKEFQFKQHFATTLGIGQKQTMILGYWSTILVPYCLHPYMKKKTQNKIESDELTISIYALTSFNEI